MILYNLISSYIQTSVKYPFNKMHSMGWDLLSRADVTLVGASTIIIIFAIVITAAVHDQSGTPFSQVITVGPVWTTNTWVCTSNSEYIVHGVLIAYGDSPSSLSIAITGVGSQPDFEFTPLKMQSFSIGGPAGSTMTISSFGTITGYLTLQTMSNARASCVQL